MPETLAVPAKPENQAAESRHHLPIYQTKVTPLTAAFNFWSKHTLEPLVFLCIFAYYLKVVTFQNLIEERVCTLHLNKDKWKCENLESYHDDKLQVQAISNGILALCDLVTAIPGAITTVLFGAWSDLYGRKLVLQLALVGLFLENSGLLIYASLHDLNAYYSFLFIFPSGIFGGLMLVLTACYSIVTDSSRSVTRANRYAALEFVMVLGLPFGMFLGGAMFKVGGYFLVFGVSALLYVVAAIWTRFIIRETLYKPQTLGWALDDLRVGARDLFSGANLSRSYRTCFKTRPYNFRKQIWLLIGGMAILIMCLMGASKFSFAFTQNQLNWSAAKYSMYQAVLHLVQAVVLVITVPLLTNKLAIKEGVLGIVGTFSLAAQLVIKSFASQPWVYFYAYLAGILGGAARIATRTRISKLVSREELGKIFSILALCEVAVPISSNLIFTKVYSVTMYTFPGAPYLAAFVLLVIPMAIFWWIHSLGPLPVGIQENLDEIDRLGDEFSRFDNFLGEDPARF